jgi:hypothetical protein
MGWRMAARLQNEVYAVGDHLDVAFRITVNEHPEFGGLELTLMDFRRSQAMAAQV